MQQDNIKNSFLNFVRREIDTRPEKEEQTATDNTEMKHSDETLNPPQERVNKLWTQIKSIYTKSIQHMNGKLQGRLKSKPEDLSFKTWKAGVYGKSDNDPNHKERKETLENEKNQMKRQKNLF